MDQKTLPLITSRNIGVALFAGSVALLMLGLQPILLGELVDRHLITMEGVGLVAMGEIVALGLGVALGDALLPISQCRLIVVAAALLAAVFDAATLYAANDGEFLAVRVIAGLATGVMLWAATAVIVRTRTPDRLAAIFMVVQTVCQMGVAMLLAQYVVPSRGWQGGFQLLAAIVLFTALPALWLPRRLTQLAPASENMEKVTWSMARLLPLAVAFLQMAALGSLWAYLEPIGLRAGFDAQGAQSVASNVLFMQVLGGATAVWLIRRLYPVFALGMGGAILAAVAGSIYLLPAGATAKFSLLCSVFGFAWLFLTPFQIGLALRADGKGRLATLVPASQLLGSAFGPLAASFVVENGDVGPVPLVSLCFAASAMIVVAFGRKRWAKAEPTLAEAYTGKVVLVAGASSGMGRTFALRLADEGASLAVTARRKDRLDALAIEIEQRGGRCLALAADAEDAAAAAAVVAACIEKFGRIDLALLNAGGAPALDMRKMDAGAVTAYMRSNYDTAVNYLFPVLNQMVKQRGGVIAHTNSLAGFLGVPLQGPYSAAKGALRLLFDTCRIEFGHYGIRFVSIYPGFVATEKTANDGMPAPLEISEDEAVDHILRAVRQQRSDYSFPLSMQLVVKLAGVLPKPVTNWILRLDLPRLPEPCDEPNVSR